ncbi:MAG: phage tail tape measure protein, partial [Oscillospiraceae bacterium]|nr:phage tail tape measure protein [Oscillospiraceae bacterium]
MPQADGYVRIVTRNDTSEAERSTEQLGDAIADAMDTSSVDRMSRAVDGLGDTLGDVDSSAVDGLRDGIDDVGSAAVTAGELIQANLISDIVMKGLEQLRGSLKDAAVHTVEVADGLDSSVKRVAAATNATETEMQSLEAVIEQVYKDNFGDGFDDIADSVAKIKQNLGELDDSEIIEVTESAYALMNVFDYGVDESSRAAKAMTRNFGISVMQAYDYIARGAQNGLDYSGELLDSISEYSIHFAKMGLDADDMFNIFAAGAENGAWNIDKIGDAVKEMSIRVIDGSDSTLAGFEKIGLNADEMATKFSMGGETARAAFSETLKALSEMEDPLQQDAAGVALLGTMWEDLGRDAVISLAGITDSAYEATGAMDGIKEMNYSA